MPFDNRSPHRADGWTAVPSGGTAANMSSLGWRSELGAAVLVVRFWQRRGLLRLTQSLLPGPETEKDREIVCVCVCVLVFVRRLAPGRAAVAQDCKEAAGKCLCHWCHPGEAETQSSSHGHILGPGQSPNALATYSHFHALIPLPPLSFSFTHSLTDTVGLFPSSILSLVVKPTFFCILPQGQKHAFWQVTEGEVGLAAPEY